MRTFSDHCSCCTKQIAHYFYVQCFKLNAFPYSKQIGKAATCFLLHYLYQQHIGGWDVSQAVSLSMFTQVCSCVHAWGAAAADSSNLLKEPLTYSTKHFHFMAHLLLRTISFQILPQTKTANLLSNGSSLFTVIILMPWKTPVSWLTAASPPLHHPAPVQKKDIQVESCTEMLPVACCIQASGYLLCLEKKTHVCLCPTLS